MAGVPHELGRMASKLNIVGDVSTYTVVGTSGSKVDDDGLAELGPGTHMLGHATVMLIDSQLAVGDVFEVRVSRLSSRANPGVPINSASYPMTVVDRYAFSTNANFTGVNINMRVMMLYSDFGIVRAADLQLALPNSLHVGNYTQSGVLRSRVPGYVLASVMNGCNAVLRGGLNVGGVMLRQVDRKRKKPAGTAEAEE